MEITPLNALKPHEYRYRIQVRVTRIWRPRAYNSDAFDGVHYIFTDINGTSVHAYIDELQHDDMAGTVEAGAVYDIFRFATVSNHMRRLKIIPGDVELKLNGSTAFLKQNNNHAAIPNHSFRLLEFEALAAEKENQQTYTDVYGCITVTNIPYEKAVNNRKKTETKCDITLTNLRRQTLSITLWGDAAMTFNPDSLWDPLKPVFAVFTTLKLGEWGKAVTANSTNHTCCFINPELSITNQYKAEFSRPGDIMRIVNGGSTQRQGQLSTSGDFKTIAQLNAIDPQAYQDQTVRCSGLIRRFSTRAGWWYRSCSTPNCFKMLQKKEEQDNKYFCDHHGLQSPQPSYLVSLIIEDQDSQATVTLMGKEAAKLFKASCEKLLGRRLYPTEQTLPEEIIEQEGNAFVFEIQIKNTGNFRIKTMTPTATLPQTQDHLQPTSETPEKHQVYRKRLDNTSVQELFPSSSAKKSRRDIEAATSLSTFLACPTVKENKKDV